MSSMDEELLALRRLVEEMRQRGVEAESLDEISDDLGDVRAGRFLALASGSEPTDADATGAFVSAEGETFDGVTYNVGAVKDGIIQAGFNTDGDMLFAGGKGRTDADGLHLDGIRYALEHTATDTAGNNLRRSVLEMFYPDGETIPAVRLMYSNDDAATELVSNGDFGTGDGTDWTATLTGASAFSVSYLSAWGYRARLTRALAATASVVSAAFAATGGTTYRARITVAGVVTARVDWYNSGGTLISSTILMETKGGTISRTAVNTNVTAPAGTATGKIYVSTTAGNSADFDDVSVQARTVLTDLVFADDGIRGLWPEQAQVGWDAAQAWGPVGGGGIARKTMAYSTQTDQWWGYVSALSQADASNGDRYILKIPLAAGTYEWRMNYRSATDRGKVELWVNGAKVSGATPFDMYAGTAAVNQAWTVSSIVIPKHGVHEFRVVVNGTSGSYYRVVASFITIRKTG